MTSRRLDARAGCRLFFKCETFQRVGAFKARGAFSRLSLLTPEERKRGVVAFSSGNHAQAVALAARSSASRPSSSCRTTRRRASSPRRADTGPRCASTIAPRRAARRSPRSIVANEARILVPPFDDRSRHRWAGHGGLELLEDVSDLDAVLDAARRRRSPFRRGGRREGAPAGGPPSSASSPRRETISVRSLAAGHPVSIPVPATIADCLQTTKPGVHTFALVSALVEASSPSATSSSARHVAPLHGHEARRRARRDRGLRRRSLGARGRVYRASAWASCCRAAASTPRRSAGSRRPRAGRSSEGDVEARRERDVSDLGWLRQGLTASTSRKT